MPAPIVQSTLDQFDLTLKHRRMTAQENSSYSRGNVEDAILSFISEKGSASSAEISRAAGMTQKTIRRYLSVLMEDGVIDAIGTINSPKRRYRLS